MRRILSAPAACIALLAMMAAPAAAVTTTPVNCGVGADLQAAIDAASPGDTLLISGTCVGNFSALKVLNIQGRGPNPTIAGGPVSTDLVLWFGGGTITSLTIAGGLGDGIWANGTTTLTKVTVRDHGAIGIRVRGPLTMVRSTVSDNGSFGILTQFTQPANIRQSTVRGNGTGIFNNGEMTLTDSTVSSNVGLGIFNASGLEGRGILAIDGSAISGNGGGGIENRWQLSIANSRVMNNTTTGLGGGIWNQNNGGTQMEFRGVLSVTDSKVMGNAASDGGGIYNSGPPSVVTLDSVMIKNNTPNNCVGC